jgi:ribosomal protein L29
MLETGDLPQTEFLMARINSIESELRYILDEIEDPVILDYLSLMTELFQLKGELQGLRFNQALLKVAGNQKKVDDELKEIADYMTTILSVYQTEADNLKKLF